MSIGLGFREGQVWMAIGLGVGFLLHRLVPAIDLGMATLIGVVTLGGCFLWLSGISTLEALYGHDDIARAYECVLLEAPMG
jgi:hypothetical protein